MICRLIKASQCAGMLQVLDWFRDHAVAGGAIILSALAASVAAYFRGIFDGIIGDVLPKGPEISCFGREWIADRWPFRQPETPPDVFRMLIAKLDGDDARGTQTQAVLRARFKVKSQSMLSPRVVF
jgi:hypothetical protein